jgi:hypothetical protein
MPREDKFFGMFESHTLKSVSAAKFLRAALNGGQEMCANI